MLKYILDLVKKWIAAITGKQEVALLPEDLEPTELSAELPPLPQTSLFSLKAQEFPPWIRVALAELGTKEIPGSGNNPRVLEYHKYTTLRATQDSVAWCSSFVNFVLAKAGPYQRSHSAAARTWLSVPTKLKGYKRHAIVILKRGNSSWQGHVGFVMDETSTHIRVLGGNQSDAVTIASYRKAAVLGYVWPTEEKR